MRPFGLFTALLVLSGCVSDLPLDDLESRESAIVGGQSNPGDPAVVALLAGGGLCTGTLITRRTVLTAAHCVDFNPSAVQVYFGTDVTNPDDPGRIDVIDAASYVWDTQFDRNNLFGGHDIALVFLERPAPASVTPIGMNRVAAPQLLGMPLKLTGFGKTDGNVEDAGEKRYVSSALNDADDQLIYFGSDLVNTCNGDSGGPQLGTVDGKQVVVGVTSFGPEGCRGFGAGTRVDAHVDSFIVPYIAANDPTACEANGVCGEDCATPDPDCPCSADDQCTAQCDTPELDPDCSCEADGVCGTGCGTADPDCDSNAAAAGPEVEDPAAGPGDLVGGCAAGTAAAQPLYILLLGLLLVRRRRRQ